MAPAPLPLVQIFEEHGVLDLHSCEPIQGTLREEHLVPTLQVALPYVRHGVRPVKCGEALVGAPHESPKKIHFFLPSRPLLPPSAASAVIVDFLIWSIQDGCRLFRDVEMLHCVALGRLNEARV